MKTRQRKGVMNTQPIIPRPCVKKPAALTSTERSRLWRQAIFKNKKLHNKVKARDNTRKKLAAIEKAKAREEDPEEAARYREKAK